MRRRTLMAIIVAVLLVPHLVWAGCTLKDVCQDVLDTLVLIIGGGDGNVITWNSSSEATDLAYYRVVRSESPGIDAWTPVEIVYPAYACGTTAAAYEVTDNPPEGNWKYAVQIFDANGLVFTVAAQAHP